MTQSIDISHCSSGKLSDYNQPLEICASATALNFMNDSYFLARSFFFLVCLAIFVAYTLCQWGIRRDNNLMILSGILAAVFVFNSIDGSTIAVIAIVIGHLIGYSLASIKLNRVTSLNRKINIKE